MAFHGLHQLGHVLLDRRRDVAPVAVAHEVLQAHAVMHVHIPARVKQLVRSVNDKKINRVVELGEQLVSRVVVLWLAAVDDCIHHFLAGEGGGP